MALGQGFLKNTSVLMSGTIVAQIIPIAISPILTRLYGPSEFALLSLYLAVANLFVLIAAFRYEQALMLPENDNEARKLLTLCLYINGFFACSVLSVFILFPGVVTIIPDGASLGRWLFLIPISILVMGIYRTMMSWSARTKKFRDIASARVVQTSCTSVSSWGGGVAALPGGLVLGEVVGQFCAALILIWRWRADILGSLKERVLDCTVLVKKYRKFALISVPHVLLDALKSSGMVFILAAFFGGEELGYYALMMRVLMAPVAIVGSSVAQVFYREATEVHMSGGDVRALVRAVTFRLSLISIPGFSLLAYIAPQLFGFIFGEDWRVAGEYTQILIPWAASHFIVMPVMQIPIIFNRQGTSLLFGVCGNFIMLGSIFIGGYLDDIVFGFNLLAILMVGYSMLLYGWIYKICKGSQAS